jgi:hypothetical protein
LLHQGYAKNQPDAVPLVTHRLAAMQDTGENAAGQTHDPYRGLTSASRLIVEKADGYGKVLNLHGRCIEHLPCSG